jgi:hypothetical protein
MFIRGGGRAFTYLHGVSKQGGTDNLNGRHKAGTDDKPTFCCRPRSFRCALAFASSPWPVMYALARRQPPQYRPHPSSSSMAAAESLYSVVPVARQPSVLGKRVEGTRMTGENGREREGDTVGTDAAQSERSGACA